MAALDFTDKTVLQECLQWIKEVAKQAGGIVTEGFLSEVIAVDVKTAFYDLVTEYDTRTEEYLIKAILDKYPDHKIIGEESNAASGVDDILTDAPTWIIDPIDGTSNFVHKIPLIAIGIALCYRKQVVLAVCYNPVMHEMFTATLGGGAHLNEKPIRCSSKTKLQEAIIADEISLATAERVKNRLLGRTLSTVPHVVGVRALGSAVLTFGYIAAGRLDSYQIEYLKPWDCAGGTLLVTEAGGVVKDSFTGGEVNIMKPMVLAAATPELYDALWQISQESAPKTLVLQ